MLQKIARIRFSSVAFVGLMALAMNLTASGSRRPAIATERAAVIRSEVRPAAPELSGVAMASVDELSH